MPNLKKMITGTLLALALASTTTTYAEETEGWQHKIHLYGWLPSLDGTLKYTIPGDPDDPGDSDGTSESSAFDKLDMVFMGAYEVRKDKWSFLTDMIYLKMSDSQEASVSLLPILDRPPLKVGSEQELTGWLLGFYGGYNMIDTGDVTLDIIAGMRYFSLELDATFNIGDYTTPPISPSVEFYDPIIGIKGAVNLNENWYMPYQFDIGGGDSDLTWQANASIGYRFDWGDVLLTYRYMHYEADGSELIEDFDLYGPKLGVVFHF